MAKLQSKDGTTIGYEKQGNGSAVRKPSMDKTTRATFEGIWSNDRQLQHDAFIDILELTDRPVGWAYEVWDELIANLTHRDNHNRAIAAQVLCNLAKSDPKERLLKDFPALLAVTKDERFVTARHCMQALWKVGVAGPKQQKLLVGGLAGRFKECIKEKNCTLIRYDILQSLRNVYDVVKDESIRDKAVELIATESDLKYRKKYNTLWRAK
jgi:hypothetical protein